MYWMKNQSKQENLIYLVVWSLLYAAPLLSLYMRTLSDANITFQWAEVFFIWKKFSVILFLFLIHNFFLAPLVIHYHRRTLYFSIITVVLAGFMIYQCSHGPEGRKPMGPPLPHMEHHRPPKPPLVNEQDILSVVILLLTFGANLGAKLYFRSSKDRQKLAELEKQNLEQQLAYLRYQISPHFFMNTLNNIHALVDINPAKAQETILELSKMMRFVLYESDKSGVPLHRELDFINTYMSLMELRFTNKVKITVDFPTQVPDKTIPPLMLISFIENAFKHGVSYQQKSFIEVKVSIESHHLSTYLCFTCCNSKAQKPNQEKGGVGLVNVKKRLDLLYTNNYKLDIKDEEDTYTVKLIIPL